MADINFQAAISLTGLANVVELSPHCVLRERNPCSPTGSAAPAAIVLEFEGTARNDGAVLRRVAPWLQKNVDVIDEWRRSLFMSRFAKHVDASAGPSTVANIDWKIQRGTDVKGKVATPAGNVLIRMNEWNVGFEGHRDALLYTGLARENWLLTGPRGTPANRFEVQVFDARREVKIRRNRDRYIVYMDLTDDEHAQVAHERCERLEKAKAAAESAVKKLPNSRCDFQRRLAVLASMSADMVGHRAFMSEGGFSLDESSRAAILAQLDCLRQTIQQATVRFDRNERLADIESIAQKHAREMSGLANMITRDEACHD